MSQNLKPWLRRPVYGKGINDADYNICTYEIDTEGKTKKIYCPFYRCWSRMLERCFSSRLKLKYPTYKDVSCCDEWLLFSNFKSWMEQQDWEGKELDKDLLVYRNKIYSPETCIFLTQRLNCFLIKNDANRGALPLGVSLTPLIHGKYLPTNRYTAYCGYRVTAKGKRSSIHLGAFYTAEEAHKAWQKEKLNTAKERLKEEKEDAKVCKGIMRIINKLQDDIINNKITEDF